MCYHNHLEGRRKAVKILKKLVSAAVCAALAATLSGCVMTVDQMYVPPRRSESYRNLQTVMDGFMRDLEYCAPTSGENQQSVQMADINGDGLKEVMVFVKGSDEHPLKILIFKLDDGEYVPLSVIEATGTAYDQVEYIQLDGEPGLELVVGRQVSDQVMRNLTVYRFSAGQPEQLLTVNYQKFLTLDMGGDGRADLFVLRPGRTENDCGVVELYSAQDGTVSRSAEVSMSQSVSKLKRIMTGSLHSGERAVFVASSVDDASIVTDVYALVNGKLTNVSMSSESGTSVKTVRNYYVYAEDIDGDGVLELPSLISMRWPGESRSVEEREHLIRWYALDSSGGETDKFYSFHNFAGGWYLQLDSLWAKQLTVTQQGSTHIFSVWNEDRTEAAPVFTVYSLTGSDRDTQATEPNLFTLYRTEGVVYAAKLEKASGVYGITQEQLINSFRLIHQDWKTGET